MTQETYKQALGRYFIGAAGAVVFTLIAYLTVTQSWFSNPINTTVVIMVLAILQLAVQLYMFLHIGAEEHPRWKSYSFAFTFIILLVVVVGSIWIMVNLNYSLGMSSDAMQEYMTSQNRKGF